MKTISRMVGSLLAVGILSVGLAAQTSAANRYDSSIQTKVTQQLAEKKEFSRVQASVEDGIVTLTGGVDLYQQKLDAAKKVRKSANVQGVRNLIVVDGKDVPDAELTAQLDRKLYYDRMGYDNLFNFITASVQNGVVTVNGEARIDVDRDSALAIVNASGTVGEVVVVGAVVVATKRDSGGKGCTAAAARAMLQGTPLHRTDAIIPAASLRIISPPSLRKAG